MTTRSEIDEGIALLSTSLLWKRLSINDFDSFEAYIAAPEKEIIKVASQWRDEILSKPMPIYFTTELESDPQPPAFVCITKENNIYLLANVDEKSVNDGDTCQ